jgi:disulfide bond formation protein DsbB
MTLVELANKKLAIETILGQLFIIASIAYVLLWRKHYPTVGKFLAKYGLWLAFLMAVVATASSLFYSNVAHFAPCDLCWFQRIFMYPLVVLFGIALYKKDEKIADYGLVMAGIGFLISLYHNFLYYHVGGLNVSCTIGGVGVSCVKRYIFEFGYITIPMMALTGFALIITFLLFKKYERNF